MKIFTHCQGFKEVDGNFWYTSQFQFQYSMDNTAWSYYMDGGVVKVNIK